MVPALHGPENKSKNGMRQLCSSSAGGGREEILRSKRRDVAGSRKPAEVLICGNAGIRKNLGASSRSTGLPQRPASSRFLFSRVPRQVLTAHCAAVEERPFKGRVKHVEKESAFRP